jgi:hypothetical protein
MTSQMMINLFQGYEYNGFEGHRDDVSLKTWILSVRRVCQDKLELLETEEATKHHLDKGCNIDNLCDYMTDLPNWFNLYLNQEARDYMESNGIKIDDILCEILTGVAYQYDEIEFYHESNRICNREPEEEEEE